MVQRAAAASLPAGDVASLVRLLWDLGPRKPPKKWLAEVDTALEPSAARQLLREWLELAAHADVVPEWPGSKIGDCRGTLFVGTNIDIVRAAVWAASRLPGEEWPPQILGVLARRGSAHNGASGFPEALALKVASAAVDVLTVRNGSGDRRVLGALSQELGRQDLLKKIHSSLSDPEQPGSDARRKSLGPVAGELLRIEDDTALEVRARQLAASGPEGEAVVLEAFAKARGTKPYILIRALGSSAPGGKAELFLFSLIATSKDKRGMALASLADIQKEGATPMLAEVVASHPSWAMRDTGLHCIALVGDRRGRQPVLDYFSRVLARKTRRDSIPPLVSIACSYLLRTADGPEEVQQLARLLSKRRDNLTPLDLRWVNEFWPGEWLTQDVVQAPQPDVEQMHAFLVNPTLQRRYHDLY